jgi:hypothetical protein
VTTLRVETNSSGGNDEGLVVDAGK